MDGFPHTVKPRRFPSPFALPPSLHSCYHAGAVSPPFGKVLIANRGEIAVRVIRACREMGIATVAVYSEADRESLHVMLADEAVLLGPAPASESYLSIPKIIAMARATRAGAIHPGYGFLAENAAFAEACAAAGLAWIGPPPSAIRSMGDKMAARRVAMQMNVPVVPGTTEPLVDDAEAARVVGDAQEIYGQRIPVDDAIRRIEGLYKPYHRALRRLFTRVHRDFGAAVLIDCHSMPSTAGAKDERPRADVVLGDRYGTSCVAVVAETIETTLRGKGYVVSRNKPYAGGFITEHYGNPAVGLHAIQLEINRALYMDERRYEKSAAFATVAADLETLAERLAQIPIQEVRPYRAAAE